MKLRYFTQCVEQILAFTSSAKLEGEDKNISPNFRLIVCQCFTLKKEVKLIPPEETTLKEASLFMGVKLHDVFWVMDMVLMRVQNLKKS